MTGTWEHLATPVDGSVACGPNRHRVRWEGGTLVALDHVGDGPVLAGVGAGGEPDPECRELCRLWERHRRDPRVLVLGARQPGDRLRVPPGLVGRLRAEAGGDPERTGLLALLALESPLQRRLQQQVAAHLASSPDPARAAVLRAATLGRLRPLLDRWGGRRAWEVGFGEPGMDPSSPVAVSVGPAWLAEVWGNYLGVVAGHLVLAVLDPGRSRTRVLAVRDPGQPPRALWVRGPAPWRALLDPADGP